MISKLNLWGTKDETEVSNFGVNKYQAKAEAIEDAKGSSLFDAEDISSAAKNMVQKLYKEGKKTLISLRDGVTPEFINRALNSRSYKVQVALIDENLDQVEKTIEKTIDEEFKDFERERRQNERAKREAAKKLAGEQRQHEIRQRDRDKKKKALRDDFQTNRSLQIQEKNAAAAANLESAKVLQDQVDYERRTHLTNYWGEQAVLLQQEAEETRKDYLQAVQSDFDFTLNLLGEEFKDRDLARMQLQVMPASVSDPIKLPSGDSLGVFGTPLGPGEYFAVDGGYVPGLDQQDMHVFDSSPQTDYENSIFDLVDSRAELERNQGLYHALNEDTKYLDEALKRLVELRDMHERDLRQIENEHSLVIEAQLAPPRRMPDKFEISSTHLRKEQHAKLTSRMEELQHSIDVAEGNKRDKESQMLLLAQKIAVFNQRLQTFEEDVDSVNGGMGQLPMVVGRNISKIRGNGPMAKPKEYYDAMVHQSRYVVFKEQEGEAINAHKARVDLDRNLWLARQSHNELRMEVDQTFSNLHEIQERMKTSLVASMKVSIVEALTSFFNSGTKLAARGFHHSGLLSWWKCRNSKLSTNMACYSGGNALGGITFEDPEEAESAGGNLNNAGVILGDANRGECYGLIKLPKMGLWSIVVSVVRSKLEEGQVPDESDYCSIRLGPSFANLQLVDYYFNKINPETGAVLYDVKFMLRGDRVAFKFEMSSSSAVQSGHLAVCTGFYEEYQLQALEFKKDPKSDRERVISSYVKILRVDELQGKHRLTKLLEELIAVEDHFGDIWDSEILQNTPQRYGKSFFLRILKAEILSELQKAKSLNLAKVDNDVHDNIDDGDDLEALKLARIATSKSLYLSRKKEGQAFIVEKAEKEIGKFVELYDEPSDSWVTAYVKGLKVDWVDNGVTCVVNHVLEEVNKGGEILNTLVVDLSKRRYFESAQQEFTKESVTRWKQNRAWKARLKELNDMMVDASKKYKEAFQTVKTQAEGVLNAEITTLFEDCDGKAEAEAISRYDDPRTVEWINNRIPDIILEMRKGVIERDLDLLPKEQAELVAKERFRAQYKQARQSALERIAIARKEKMHMRLSEKLEEFKKAEEDYLSQIKAEIFTLEFNIRELWEMERAEAVKKLKFDPEVFKLVVPQADQCEHLKSKAWGNSYGKGVRCVNCGKELTDLFKEESQILGYGSGCDPKMYDAVKRHRKDEASFRPSGPGELVRVEKERVRLEKERRIMEESEEYFYDFADLKCIYEFDQRHSQYIKKFGKFRQGLQWTEDELNVYEEKKIEEKKAELIENNVQMSALDNFDPLDDVEEPPPTFRAMDERRRAQFGETLFGIGRLHNFQKKITALKNSRVDLLADLHIYGEVLTFIHKDSFVFEHDLSALEEDLDRTAKLLATYEKMQQLWAQASRIERQASRDKKKAEMRQAGLWGSVKEAIDTTTFLREETRALLKLKLMYESKYDETKKAIGDCRLVVTKAYEDFLEFESHTQALLYCRPGNYCTTRYGFGKIWFYRDEDEMVLIILPFGKPSAKLWIHSSEIISGERGHQQSERLLMEVEDNRMKKFFATERISIKKELYLMRNEENGMKEFWNFMDCMKYEDNLVKAGIEKSIAETYSLVATKKFKEITEKSIKEVISKKVKMNNESIKNFKGPKAARPKKLKRSDITLIRKDMELELKQKFLAKALRQSEKDVKANLVEERQAFFQRYIADTMISQFVDRFIVEVAEEAVVEGRAAKDAAEKFSSLIFPNPVWMQHSSYQLIRDLWKDRKAFLKRNIETKLGLATKLANEEKSAEVDEAEASRILEQKRLKRLELKRQKILCAEMDAEYKLCKDFYQWELIQNLRERRLMKEEEQETKAYLKEMARLEELKKSAYNVSGGNLEDQQKDVMVTDYDNRRKQLKDLTIERRKIAEEIEWMVDEDKRSKLLQDMVRLERQKLAFTQIFGADENADDGNSDINLMPDGSVVIPPWLTLPENWVEMTQSQQNKFVYIMTKRRNLAFNVFKNLEKERKRLEVIYKRGKKAWKDLNSRAELRAWKSEIAYMEAEEECKETEFHLQELQDNMRKMFVFCRAKGEEELRARTELRKMEELARKRTKELEEATEWLDICIRRSKTRDKLKRRVTNDCKFVDTDSITGFHQRFKTEDLRDRLYWMYFQKIVFAIVNRAELIATERKQMTIQEQLSTNRASLIDRTIALKFAWKDIQRDDRLRLRRSALNRSFFPRSRRNTLLQRFSSWVRFFYWNRGHREAFTLKYEVLLRQARLDNQYKNQLISKPQTNSQLNHKVTMSTLMQKHRERTVQCKRCIEFYLESQNNCFSCLFHTGVFTFTCPKYCKNPGLTLKCVAHKRKRWTCCDASKENIQGCSRRYHVPKDTDPVYDNLLHRLNERDADVLNGLDDRLDQAVTDNWILKEKEIVRGQLTFVEEKIENDRQKSVKFDKLKFI